MRCTAPVFLRRLPALPGLWLVLLAMLILTGEQGFCARSAQAAAPEQVQTQAVAQPAVAPAAQGGGVQIALEDAGLADFLRFMGQFLGSTPVFRDDQIPPAKVTIHSPGLLGPTEVRALFEIVLRTAGLETSNRGGVLYVLPAATPAERGRPRLPPDAHILARALPSSVAANALDTLTNMMERLRSDRGQVQASAAARTVVVADTAPRVAQLRPVLDAVAAAAGTPDAVRGGFHVDILPLGRQTAALAARKVDLSFKGQPVPMPVVLPLDWSNSLLLAGGEPSLTLAKHFLAQLEGAGSEAPVLRAFRPRFIRPEKLAEAMTGLLSGAGSTGARVRVDAEAGSVLALADPALMARFERLAEDLDQPRSRVYIEALVVDLPPELEQELAALPLAAGVVPYIVNPVGQGRSFALVEVGSGVAFRGRAADDPRYGLDSLAALLEANGQARVLMQPRMAVRAGGEAKVSQTTGGRVLLSFSPKVEAGSGIVEMTVTVEDVTAPGGPQTALARLSEGQTLLLLGGGALPKKAARPSSSQKSGADTPGRLGIVVSARVVHPAKVGHPERMVPHGAPPVGVGPAANP